jgi:hypothetical protein
MEPVVRFLMAAVSLAAGLGLAGCSPTAGKSWGGGGGTIVRFEDGAPVSYTVERLVCDDQVYMVLAANGCSGGGGGGGSGAYRGQLLAKDGRPIAWSCSTQDTKSGKVVIDGKTFDLADGRLFLVWAKEVPVRVEQVVIDAEQLQRGSDTKNFPDLAQADARIAAFLEACKDAK